MWTTVLVLALALNLEPHRLGIIGLLILRKNPVRQLLAFLVTSFLSSAAVGLTVLFLVDRGSLLRGGSSAGVMQIAVGTLMLMVAAVLFTNIRLPGNNSHSESDSQSSGIGLVDAVTKRAGRLASGGSVWFAVILGLGIALPSVDYVALLLLIASSGETQKVQITALFTFLTIANAILLVPVFSYVVAKEKTIRALSNLRTWVLARGRREFAALLTLIGLMMIAVGLTHR